MHVTWLAAIARFIIHARMIFKLLNFLSWEKFEKNTMCGWNYVQWPERRCATCNLYIEVDWMLNSIFMVWQFLRTKTNGMEKIRGVLIAYLEQCRLVGTIAARWRYRSWWFHKPSIFFIIKLVILDICV